MKLPVDHIYFISLKRAATRRNKLIEHLKSLRLTDQNGEQAEWHEANNGNYITHWVDNSIKRANNRPSMSMSEIGCCASHREVWTKIVQNGHQSALVLEDDARIHSSKLMNLINHWNKLPEFDFLHLGWNYYAGYKEQTIEKVEIAEIPNLWKGDGMWLTHAYIITNELALEWLNRTKCQTNGLDAMTADMQSDCRAYGFQPHIAYQESKGSGMRTQIIHTG